MPAEAKLSDKILDSLPASLIILDDKKQVRLANKQAKKILKYFADKTDNLTLENIFPTLKEDLALKKAAGGLILNTAGEDYIVFLGNIEHQDFPGWTTATLFRLSDFEPINKELFIAKKELEQIINCSYDEIFVTDGDGNVLRLSASTCKMLYGEEPENIIGRNVKDLEAEGYYGPSLYDRITEKKQRVTAIQNYRTGQKFIVTANPLFDENNNIIRIIANSRNISEFIDLGDQIQESEFRVKQFYNKLIKLKQEAQLIGDLIVESANMQSVIDTARRVAHFDSTVLLLGESGVGKDLVAKLIHSLSLRADKPFQKINCGAIPDNLLESELFGYAPGAFTGALREGRMGLIEAAQGGTLYLDEIGEMPYFLQVKLLQVIEEKVVTRVGSSKLKEVDIRIIAATHKNLKEMAVQKQFREDLYYRLNVISLHLPPLRERPEDLKAFCNLFLERFNKNFSTEKNISPAVIDAFLSYVWPGNVRELENLIERFLVMGDEETMSLKHLPQHMLEKELHTGNGHCKTCKTRTLASISTNTFAQGCQEPSDPVTSKMPAATPKSRQSGDSATLKQTVEEAEIAAILEALKKQGKISSAAKILGVSQSTLMRRMNKYNIKYDYAKMTPLLQE